MGEDIGRWDRQRTQLDSLRDNISTAPAGVSPRVHRKIVSAQPAPTNTRRGQDRWREGERLEGRPRVCACVSVRERALRARLTTVPPPEPVC